MAILETATTMFVGGASSHLGKECMKHHMKDAKKVIDDGWKRDYEANGITRLTEDKRSTGLNPA